MESSDYVTVGVGGVEGLEGNEGTGARGDYPRKK